ncbi:MAG: DinB family protein [Chloroflexi bacterium]|nr:DinB family protein [Chloroflexota bacterium]MBU1750164.1 DinB family protein [Chloroflexota bacterium]MBU1878794.1 DinB family protein [Chloroflexota bacterium]
MDPIVQEIVNVLEATRLDVARIIREAPPETLNWQPVPEANSLWVIATHMAGSERFWIGEVVGGQAAGRNRDAEFQARCASEEDREALLMRLGEVGRTSWQVLSRFSPAQLLQKRTAWDRDTTALWVILHVVEHNSLHLGHMELTFQMWEQAQGNADCQCKPRE